MGAAELPVAGLSRRTALFPLYPSGLYAKGLLPDRENANMFSACKSGKSSALPVRPFTSASESASSSASSSSDRASDSGGGKCETLRLSYRDLMTTSEKCKGDTNSNAQCRGIKDRAKRKQEALKVCREANNQADSDDSDAAAVTSGSTSNSASSSSDSAASIGREGGREGELGHSGSSGGSQRFVAVSNDEDLAHQEQQLAPFERERDGTMSNPLSSGDPLNGLDHQLASMETALDRQADSSGALQMR